MIVAVLLVDQLSKAWAWRSTATAYVDSGGGLLAGPSFGTWFEQPVPGALLDIVDLSVLVSLGALLAFLVRRVGRRSVYVPMAMVVGGWLSNTADRLGLHQVTAPGSARGVVDFAPWSGGVWNLADLAISVGTVWLVLALIPVGVQKLLESPRPPLPRDLVQPRR